MDYSGKIIRANPVNPTQTSASGVWTLDDAAAAVRNNSWPIVGVPNPISKSLRFNSADSAYLNRTPGSAGNQKTWTWSGWVKRGSIADGGIFSAGTGGTNYFNIRFQPDYISVVSENSSLVIELRTTPLYRDPSAWYHIVFALDTTQATSTNRAKLYVNGTQVTAFSTSTYPSLNLDMVVNSAVVHYNGRIANSGIYFDGYLTEINFIDGQALTPSSFGQSNPNTGVWEPKPYTGTYGGNGFYLNFSDSSGVAALGNDYSGNNNDWTPNNFSVTAGVGNDSLTDVPTQWVGYSATNVDSGGIVRGNYVTLNPLTTTTGTYTQGNLRYAGSNSGKQSNGTISVSTGKWYWEVTLGNAPFTPRAGNTDYNAFGFALPTTFDGAFDISNATTAIALADNGYYKNFTNARVDGGTAFSSGDVLAIAVDLDANTFTFYRNNSQLATGTIGGTAGRTLCPFIGSYSGAYGVMDCNFGQRPFAYTPPSGFVSLCTTNLPTPDIGATATTRADDYFNTVLYTGTGSSQSITGVGFQPDWVWIKSRSAATDHGLYDAVRGVQKQMESNNTNAETTESTGLTAFGTDGFTVGALAQLNTSSATYVAWNWKANGAGSSNTAGSITSTVSANTTAGFSVVTYTGNGSAGATVGHGLGVAPSFIIVKNRVAAGNDWLIYHIYLGATQSIAFDTAAAITSSTRWNNTAPSSTLLTLGTSGGVNGNLETYVAYCFAPVAGYSAFGSYTGNGSTDGPFVYLGFRPKYVLIKPTSLVDSWQLEDAARSPFNTVNDQLFPNTSNAEQVDSSTRNTDFLSNGFKIRGTNGGINQSSATYIYAAFAENPFKYSLAR